MAQNCSNPLNNRLAFYHQNEALLIQFFLHESLSLHRALKNKSSSNNLSQVIGQKEPTMQSWQSMRGHFPRLYHYTALMIAHFEDPMLCRNLQLNLEKASIEANNCCDLEDKSEACIKEMTALRKHVREIIKLLFNKVRTLQKKTSLLFFLLKHQEQLDALFRKPVVKLTILHFFPEGIADAQKFFAESFSKKGIDHLLTQVESKLAKLDKNES